MAARVLFKTHKSDQVTSCLKPSNGFPLYLKKKQTNNNNQPKEVTLLILNCHPVPMLALVHFWTSSNPHSPKPYWPSLCSWNIRCSSLHWGFALTRTLFSQSFLWLGPHYWHFARHQLLAASFSASLDPLHSLTILPPASIPLWDTPLLCNLCCRHNSEIFLFVICYDFTVHFSSPPVHGGRSPSCSLLNPLRVPGIGLQSIERGQLNE